ncbi:MMS1 N and CPSF A and bZIP 2 domain containing pr otein [Trichuris trichiura]|uniref:DNA damage-binding protein 1 n=1 Tax=Trichuris trichiura TaxID=36087 RepID=A0A077ZIH4_TRITR|nr:MMS1 N and CPSF A and bZIP 2 domain containing pr otein [Trichuris trichiura]
MPRKRARLTHLTPEQRDYRRKMRNRVAAQTARDRKKVAIAQLHETVMALEAEVHRLKCQNDQLATNYRIVLEENQLLRRQFIQSFDGMHSEISRIDATPFDPVEVETKPSTAIEPAALISAPLPKAQDAIEINQQQPSSWLSPVFEWADSLRSLKATVVHDHTYCAPESAFRLPVPSNTDSPFSSDLSYKSGDAMSSLDNSGEQKSLLFLFTSKCQVAVVDYVNNAFVTLDTYKVSNFCFRMAESETRVIDVTFLHSSQKPTIAYLYEDDQGCHLATLICDKLKGTIYESSPRLTCVEFDCALMFPIPKPVNGLIILGLESVVFSRNGATFSIKPECAFTPGLFCCFGIIEAGKMYVIGDTRGRIYSLSVGSAKNFDGLRMRYLCEVSRPQTLTYLGDGILFVGSRVSDSMLVRVPALCGDTTSQLSVLGSYPSLAPIVDLIQFSPDPLIEAPAYLACSGHGKDGSLRLIRGSIENRESARIPLSGAVQAWFVHYANTQPDGGLLIVSFVFGTKTYTLRNEQVEEVEIPTIPSCERTWLAMNYHCNDWSGLILVTTDRVRMMDVCRDGELLSEWSSLERTHIDVTAFSANTGHIVVCYGPQLFLLSCDNRELLLIAENTFPNDISCADISDFGGTEEIGAVGQWLEDSIILFRPVSMQMLATYSTQGVARSLQFCLMEDAPRLFVSTSDRYVVALLLTDQQSGEYKVEKTFGEFSDYPTLKCVKIRDKTAVIACCSQPFILYRRKKRLTTTRVLVGPTSSVSTINTGTFPDSFLFCLKDSLSVISIVELSSVHCRKIALGETPVRLSHQVETRTFAVCTEKEVPSWTAKTSNSAPTSISNTAKQELVANPFRKHMIKAEVQVNTREEAKRQNHFLVFDQDSCEALVCYKMSPNEKCCSVLSCQLANDPNVYYIVGTALIIRSEREASVGRLLVFKVKRDLECAKDGRDTNMDLVHEKTVNGAPYSMVEFNKKLLVAVNNVVLLFEWVLRNKKHSLQLECFCTCSVAMIQLRKLSPSSVLGGDFIEALVLFIYKPAESTLEGHDIDYHTDWLTGIGAVSPNVFLSADVAYNLYIADVTDETENGGKFPVQYNGFHIGQYVNVFCPRNMNFAMSSEIVNGSAALYATAEGSVGTVCLLTPRYFSLFKTLELAIMMACSNFGVFDHSYFRRAVELNKWETDTSCCSKIVDGNVIARLLDLPAEQKNTILRQAVDLTNEVYAPSGFSFDCDSVEHVVENMFSTISN